MLAAACATALSAGAAPATITMYDVLKSSCRGTVANQNFGTPAGDAYFMLKNVMLPYVCTKCEGSRCRYLSPAYFDCSDKEVHAAERVVRKVEVTFSGNYSRYALCNAQKDAGDDACPADSYDCQPSDEVVGREEVAGGTSAAPTPGTRGRYNDEADYWNYNTANTLGGYWYSLAGVNGASPAPSWSARTVKSINSRCQQRWLYKRVQEVGADCFNGCASPTNTTSECWIRCFYDTTLGSNSATSASPSGGLGGETIAQLWSAGFESEDPSVGGCPPARPPAAARTRRRPTEVRPPPERAPAGVPCAPSACHASAPSACSP